MRPQDWQCGCFAMDEHFFGEADEGIHVITLLMFRFT
jgi:hypothetical protein